MSPATTTPTLSLPLFLACFGTCACMCSPCVGRKSARNLVSDAVLSCVLYGTCNRDADVCSIGVLVAPLGFQRSLTAWGTLHLSWPNSPKKWLLRKMKRATQWPTPRPTVGLKSNAVGKNMLYNTTMLGTGSLSAYPLDLIEEPRQSELVSAETCYPSRSICLVTSTM